MSHASGAVRFVSDGAVLFYEYNGTADRCVPKLWRTLEEVWHKDNWRSDDGGEACQCGNSEPVILHTNYGNSFGWPGTACRECMRIASGFEPFDEGTERFAGDADWTKTIYKVKD